MILVTVLLGVFRKSFDPFAPHWMFLTGYSHLYVIQALSYRDWAIRIRGIELVTAANERALWALLWFLFVYYCGPGKFLAARFPRPPSRVVGARDHLHLPLAGPLGARLRGAGDGAGR